MKLEADLVVFNCGQLLTLAGDGRPRRGGGLSDLGLVEDGMIVSREGRIVAAGPRGELEDEVTPLRGCVEVDAGSGVAMPGFVDCHTHTVFARYRTDEYEWRVTGTPYEEVARRGGGIARSVAHLRGMEEEELLEVSRRRVANCIRYGTTTLEIKSGYGLDLENELKQLRVIRSLAADFPIEIIPTFLGAHAVPPEYAGRREKYVELVIEEMIPAVSGENLAEFIDVFSEKGVFEVGEAERILRSGVESGMKAKVHADELHDTGSTAMAVRIGAVSADHLTKAAGKSLRLLAGSSVIAVLLPGTSFGLPSLDFADARRMVDEGVAVALASDFNPGSSPSESMSMMAAIACSHMGLSPSEAIAAATYNAAFAVCRESEVGSLEPGKRADFLLLGAEDFREIPYRFGVNLVERVFVWGREWIDRPHREGGGRPS